MSDELTHPFQLSEPAETLETLLPGPGWPDKLKAGRKWDRGGGGSHPRMYIYDTCESIRAKRTSPAPKHANGASKRVHLSIGISRRRRRGKGGGERALVNSPPSGDSIRWMRSFQSIRIRAVFVWRERAVVDRPVLVGRIRSWKV